MKVLVACEESQRVCTAFRQRGHIAYSCDIQEPSGGHPEWHILGDVLEVLDGGGFDTMGETTARSCAGSAARQAPRIAPRPSRASRRLWRSNGEVLIYDLLRRRLREL